MEDLIKNVNKMREIAKTYFITHPKYTQVKTDILVNLRVASSKSLVATEPMKYYRVFDTLIGPFAQVYLPATEIKIFHGPVYSFFNKVLKINPKTYFNYIPTKVFEEFIKGITLFEESNNTILSQPAYHRPDSCGRKDIDFLTKFQKKNNVQALRMCIIERKIYDHIYEHILYKQDAGHLLELHRLERLYLDHTLQKIDVTVHFKNDIVPYLLIVRTYRKDNLISVETFDKRSDGKVLIETYQISETFAYRSI